MSSFQVLMPFARSNSSNQIVGIEQVKRGDGCNCHCLSCGTPVTARLGNINQWHFAHRTDNNTTSSECEFSPVTALALIVRQQLPTLVNFDLDEWDFNDVQWDIECTKHGIQVDAYTKDLTSNVSVIVDIPFESSPDLLPEAVPKDIDIILKVDTHMMARQLYPSKSPVKLLSSEEAFNYLINNWEDLVEMLRWPKSTTEQAEASEHEEKLAPNDNTSICVCCNSNSASYGKGLLCGSCVWKQVGRRFNSMSEMVTFYSKKR
ncbi:phosphatidylinositol kinase [Vibrio splendidus]|uniref:Competence protein CoiA family protein n=1 Tax=Vibrio splendidus TaxID=29497 RepID=A0AB35MYP7_VIBSP|nr:competence protein CoiA family protein [Vibrio splendidus]MDP2501388.1 competence protein CoiA family protein [Vibrio splendidus]PMM77673.1 phosphatidylinositol kinase [Vibrio splendidus]